VSTFQENHQAYSNYLADYYDALFETSEQEYNFYRHFLDYFKDKKALEVASGTGQLLVPYREEGFVVDGVDSSFDMLAQCQKKLDIFSLQAELYHQRMEQLALKQKYSLLFIPSCSFMHVTDYNQAFTALKRFYEHLLPGGKLLISLFVPQTLTRENSFTLSRDIVLDIQENAHERILLSTFFEYSPLEQIRRGLYKLELYSSTNLQHTKLYDLAWRWYGLHEFQQLLKLAGFKNSTAYGDYTFEPVSAHHESFVVVAEK
jgi:ubiquinone/menaquinone biosynthesis C-methylase UbiE